MRSGLFRLVYRGKPGAGVRRPRHRSRCRPRRVPGPGRRRALGTAGGVSTAAEGRSSGPAAVRSGWWSSGSPRVVGGQGAELVAPAVVRVEPGPFLVFLLAMPLGAVLEVGGVVGLGVGWFGECEHGRLRSCAVITHTVPQIRGGVPPAQRRQADGSLL